MALATDVFTVFKQQVFSPFKDGFILFRSFTVFGIPNFIDNTVKIGHYMEQIEYYFGLRQFFLTALINGSHISMTTASIPLRCLAFN